MTPRERLLHTSPETRALELRFSDADCDAWVDDVHLEELRLTRSQDLALIKGRMARDVDGRGRRLVRRGRLLPVPDPEAAIIIRPTIPMQDLRSLHLQGPRVVEVAHERQHVVPEVHQLRATDVLE